MQTKNSTTESNEIRQKAWEWWKGLKSYDNDNPQNRISLMAKYCGEGTPKWYPNRQTSKLHGDEIEFIYLSEHPTESKPSHMVWWANLGSVKCQELREKYHPGFMIINQNDILEIYKGENKAAQGEGENKFTGGEWKQGYTLITNATRNWSEGYIAHNNEHENKMVFTNFSEGDEGRSRKLICTCENKQDALLISQSKNMYEALKGLEKDWQESGWGYHVELREKVKAILQRIENK